jgi:DNA topoisomerase VI subunit B
MIEQDLLNEIIKDTSSGGKYCKFYEMLQEELSQYSEKRIEDIKGTLKFDDPNLDVESLDKMEIIYKYSCLI